MLTVSDDVFVIHSSFGRPELSTVVKSRRVGWAGHVACVVGGET